MTPTIILVRPQMGENIGAAARAMANFGLEELRLVAPRDGWPNPKAADTAGRAIDLIDAAAVHATTREAVADCQYVLAMTARSRTLNLPVMETRPAMTELAVRAARGEKVAVLFGPERTGLENEDIMLADAIVTIPVSESYPSLNVGQAVVVACYEWRMASVKPEKTEEVAAPRAELSGLFDQLEAALDAVNFWRVPEKKEVMWRNIRTSLIRAGMNEQEIATWRGIVKAFHSE